MKLNRYLTALWTAGLTAFTAVTLVASPMANQMNTKAAQAISPPAISSTLVPLALTENNATVNTASTGVANLAKIVANKNAGAQGTFNLVNAKIVANENTGVNPAGNFLLISATNNAVNTHAVLNSIKAANTNSGKSAFLLNPVANASPHAAAFTLNTAINHSPHTAAFALNATPNAPNNASIGNLANFGAVQPQVLSHLANFNIALQSAAHASSHS